MDDPESSSSPLDDVPVRFRREPDQSRKGHRSSKDRDRLYMGGSTRDIARLLVYEERHANDLRKLAAMMEQLRAETLRADTAESKAREAALRFKTANEARVLAQQDAQRANEALRLYQLQLDNAQREINKAQQIIDAVEAQRLEAEESAAHARDTARKLKEEKVISLAKEQGRREGLEEGLVRGRSIGFEEGRAEGYARGRDAAVRTRRPYVEDVPESPEEDEDRSVGNEPQSGPSGSSPEQYESRHPSDYSQVIDRNSLNSRRHMTPAPEPQPEPIKNHDIHPTIVHNMTMSPSHPPVEFPPDGWIPKADEDSRIRIPPPHELAPPPPTPSPPPSLTLQNAGMRDATDDRPPLRIPPPATDYGDSAMSDSDSTTGTAPGHRRPRHRRRRSSESQSTTMSQFELLGPPVAPAARNTVRERPNVLSAIAEERERTSSMSSPVPGAGNSPYAPSTTSTFYMPLNRPSPQASASDIYRYDDGARDRNQNIYMRPAHSPNSSPELGLHVGPPAPSLRPPSQARGSRGSSLSPEYDIKVQPPSVPESPQSRTAIMTPHLLSAEDVPLPVVNDNASSPEPPQQATGQGMPSMSGVAGATPIVLTDGQLPPGFQPIGPPIAAGSFMPMGGPQPGMGMMPQTMYSGSTGPAGVPLPPSTYGGTPSVSGSNIPGAFPTSATGEQVVIPHLMPSAAPGSVHPGSRYSRSALRDSSSDSDVSSRLGGSLDSLTTPPARRKELSSGQATPGYAVAPIPPNVTYPIPPTPRSASSRTTAARVPLPSSTAASVTSPGSTVGHIYGQTPYSRSNLALDAGSMNRPLSPVMGSARGTPAPLPVQVEPRRSIYDLRGRNTEDDPLQYGAASNAGPVQPPSVARMSSLGSPTVSQVSLAPTNISSKSKKSKKAKKKSRIASVEEAPDED